MPPFQTGPRVKLESEGADEPGTQQLYARAAVTEHNVYAFKGLEVQSPKLGGQESGGLPLPKQQPPRGARW